MPPPIALRRPEGTRPGGGVRHSVQHDSCAESTSRRYSGGYHRPAAVARRGQTVVNP
jgi:hypothetical protein